MGFVRNEYRQRGSLDNFVTRHSSECRNPGCTAHKMNAMTVAYFLIYSTVDSVTGVAPGFRYSAESCVQNN
jgi:hypothetical protein